jgi:hypothetical protein
MRDVNDIFSKNIIKIAQVSELKFEQPVFESQSNPEQGKELVEKPIGETSIEQPVDKKPEVTERPANQTSVPKKLSDIVKSEIDNQTYSLLEAERLLAMIRIQRDDVNIDPIRRLIQDAISSIKVMQDITFGVQVV